MKISEYHLGFIGFGHMAQVIYQAINHAKLIPRSQIYFNRRDPSKLKKNEQEFGITSTSLKTIVEKSNILIIAVRPNQADLVLKELEDIGVRSKMIVTVVAGIKLDYYKKYLGNQNFLLRVMPNIASAVGEGMTVFTYGENSSIEFKSVTHLLFSCMGQVMEVAEEFADVACSIAGSGPGFVFRLIEAMARFGESKGLSYEMALEMATQTFTGAARLISKGANPKALIMQIATPNGTTEAGFNMMVETEIEKSLGAVLQASTNRSKEISDKYS